MLQPSFSLVGHCTAQYSRPRSLSFSVTRPSSISWASAASKQPRKFALILGSRSRWAIHRLWMFGYPPLNGFAGAEQSAVVTDFFSLGRSMGTGAFYRPSMLCDYAAAPLRVGIDTAITTSARHHFPAPQLAQLRTPTKPQMYWRRSFYASQLTATRLGTRGDNEPCAVGYELLRCRH